VSCQEAVCTHPANSTCSDISLVVPQFETSAFVWRGALVVPELEVAFLPWVITCLLLEFPLVTSVPFLLPADVIISDFQPSLSSVSLIL
jgi:hypothetical protein